MERMMPSYRYLYKQQQILQHIPYGERTDEMTNPREFSIPKYGPPLPPEVTVELVNRELWQQFHGETTEMIITKSGRRMFPSLQLDITGLQDYLHYYVVVELFPASLHRHKYCGNADDVNGKNKGGNLGGWTTAGPAEQQAHLNRRIYLHPDGPAMGAHWKQHKVSFGKLKVTNNTADPGNNVVLTSMHRYIPRIWIFQCEKVNSLDEFYSCSIPSSLFVFKETEFIAVTAYQNESITRLKIDHNPFAKGFRETGQSRCKRKFQPATSYHRLSQTNDEEHVFSPDVSRRNVQDDRRPRTPEATRSEIAGSDDGVGVTASPQSSMSSPDRQDEMPSRLHRPWLNPSPVFARRSNSLSVSPSSSSSSSSSSSVSPSSSIIRHPVISPSYNRFLHGPVVTQYEYPVQPCYFTCIMYRHDMRRIWPLYL